MDDWGDRGSAGRDATDGENLTAHGRVDAYPQRNHAPGQGSTPNRLQNQRPAPAFLNARSTPLYMATPLTGRGEHHRGCERGVVWR